MTDRGTSQGKNCGPNKTGRGSLQQGFGLPGGVLGLEVLVGVDFVFYGEQLGLQFVPEGWQGVSNVVGKLLNKTKQNHTHRRQVEDELVRQKPAFTVFLITANLRNGTHR